MKAQISTQPLLLPMLIVCLVAGGVGLLHLPVVLNGLVSLIVASIICLMYCEICVEVMPYYAKV